MIDQSAVAPPPCLDAPPAVPPAAPRRASSKEHPVQRRRRVLYAWRLRQIRRTIPKDTTGRNVARYARYAALVASLGKKQFARVIYPWQPRPLSPADDPSVRVFRGRLSNPTALR